MMVKDLFGSVNYYGIGDIIRNYSGFTRLLPLPVSVQHGWYLKATPHDSQKYASENWYWTKDIELKHKDKFDNIRTRAVGSPFLYLLKNINYEESPRENRQGSIVFPAHSSEFDRVSYDFALYADMLEALPEKYKPITVCLYYLDLEKGMEKYFVEKGFNVVTNGSNLYEQKFLINYVNNTKDKLYAFFNSAETDPASAVLYAVMMGLKSFYYGPKVEKTISSHAPENEIKAIEEGKAYKTKWRDYFAYPENDIKKQQEFCESVLGTEFVLNRKEMKRILYCLCFNWRYLYLIFIKILLRFAPLIYLVNKVRKVRHKGYYL